jgi:ABC-type Fe3+-hydroxamate transport system substrate-binding protein
MIRTPTALDLDPDPDLWRKDALGVEHAREPDARIVCLVPSITELLCDLGLGDRLVGRTGFCIHPKEALERVSKVGGTKSVNIEKIRQLAPSHVIVNVDENEKPTADVLAQFVPNVVVTHPQHPLDNLKLYRLFGHVFGAEARAAQLCDRFKAAYTRLSGASFTPRSVLYLVWKDPWMTVSPATYIGSSLGLVRWHQIATEGEKRYPAIDLQRVAPQVELILLSSEPYRFGSQDQVELAQAFPRQRVLLVDGEMLSWYGSRAIAGLDYLRRLASGDFD